MTTPGGNPLGIPVSAAEDKADLFSKAIPKADLPLQVAAVMTSPLSRMLLCLSVLLKRQTGLLACRELACMPAVICHTFCTMLDRRHPAVVHSIGRSLKVAYHLPLRARTGPDTTVPVQEAREAVGGLQPHPGGKQQDPSTAAAGGAATGVGDAGASWRMKALRRAQAQAAEQGGDVASVLAERWGSVAQFERDSKARAAHRKHHLPLLGQIAYHCHDHNSRHQGAACHTLSVSLLVFARQQELHMDQLSHQCPQSGTPCQIVSCMLAGCLRLLAAMKLLCSRRYSLARLLSRHAWPAVACHQQTCLHLCELLAQDRAWLIEAYVVVQPRRTCMLQGRGEEMGRHRTVDQVPIVRTETGPTSRQAGSTGMETGSKETKPLISKPSRAVAVRCGGLPTTRPCPGGEICIPAHRCAPRCKLQMQKHAEVPGRSPPVCVQLLCLL